jgi:uncharacterized protein
MQRKDREITDRAEIDAILGEATVCRLGLSGDEGPYIVPMCFGYEGTFLYLHSAPEASKNLSGSLKTFRSSRISSLMTFDTSPLSPRLGFDGKKITMIRKDPRCCFEVDICDRIISSESPCSWGMRYRSVIGFGRAEILEDPEEKKHGLNCIMRHYGGGTHLFSESDLESVAVIRIAVESMTGKKHI